jgi:hypothetical protein
MVFSVKGVGPSEWNNYLSWQIYNGSAWIDTIVSDGYPGQNATAAPFSALPFLEDRLLIFHHPLQFLMSKELKILVL